MDCHGDTGPGTAVGAGEVQEVLDLLGAASDLTIVVAPDRTVETVVANPRSGLAGLVAGWEGQPLQSLFAEESWAKLAPRLEQESPGPAMELNHAGQVQYEFPVRYVLRPWQGRVLMMGRDLRPLAEVQQQLVLAHRAIGRDHEAQRELETRYRVLMEENSFPLLIVSETTGRIVDLNSSAARLLGAARNDLLNSPVAQEFDGRRRGELIESLSRNATSDQTSYLDLTVRRTAQRVKINAKLFRAARDRLLLCRIGLSESAQSQEGERSLMLQNLFEKGADAIVFLDGNGLIKAANEAFLNLTDSHSPSVVIDRAFSDFLSRGAVDLKVLLDNVKRLGHLRHYRTRLNTDYMGEVSVELSASLFEERGRQIIGIVARDSAVRDSIVWPTAPGAENEGLRNVMRLVGYSTLKEIVDETTEIIEKMCIEAALEMSGNNRAAAAELLSLSRQSLYVKLRKFGILNKETSDQA
ncbi:transcriptional regulator PpsR [Rhodobacter calidifons]|uniref:transcriptional regulator PpsR n=1 Tax=Rhodobacter calidifons TaxID=2715277 RepID=UPI001F5FF89B|nr:transcriptional regulator PpsR [Rhodobacter calidifons]